MQFSPIMGPLSDLMKQADANALRAPGDIDGAGGVTDHQGVTENLYLAGQVVVSREHVRAQRVEKSLDFHVFISGPHTRR